MHGPASLHHWTIWIVNLKKGGGRRGGAGGTWSIALADVRPKDRDRWSPERKKGILSIHNVPSETGYNGEYSAFVHHALASLIVRQYMCYASQAFDVKYFWESLMRIYQRKNGVWYIEVGHGKRRSLYTKDKDKALRMLEKCLPLCAYCEKKPIAKNKHKYCSDKCRQSAGDELRRYGALRRKILDSFKNRCAICSAKRRLTVQFVDNTGTIVSTTKRDNDGLDIVVICRSCLSQVQMGNRVEDILPGVGLFEDFNKKAVSILQNAAIAVRDL